jgi:hypothetical protein
MSDLVDFLKEAAQKTFYPDGDPASGDAYKLAFGPALTAAEIVEVERKIGAPLPQDVVELLGFCSSINGPLGEGIDFTGTLIDRGQAIPPHDGTNTLTMTIALDGAGNSWELELTGERQAKSFIWFSCHDAPVLLVQSHSVSEFVRQALLLDEEPAASLVYKVPDDQLFRVWRTNPNLLTYEQAAASGDEVIRAFARDQLEPGYLVCDLRSAPVGMGFSWARFGAKTAVKRAGKLRLFAYAKPQRPGLMEKVFG